MSAATSSQVSSHGPSRQGRRVGSGGDGAVMLAKYRTTAVLAATSYIGDSPLFLVDFVVRLARVAVLLSIWRTIFAGRGPVSGMTLGAVLTYTLVAEVFADPLNVRSELGNALWQGTIAVRLLQPFGIIGQFVAETSGQWLIRFGCFSLPLLALAPLPLWGRFMVHQAAASSGSSWSSVSGRGARWGSGSGRKAPSGKGAAVSSAASSRCQPRRKTPTRRGRW
jgi:hypothetical protein